MTRYQISHSSPCKLTLTLNNKNLKNLHPDSSVTFFRMSEQKSVLVYGGSGALGRELVSAFKKANIHVVSVDVVSNAEAHHDIQVSGQDMGADASKIKKELHNKHIDAVFCVAGGWTGGNIASEETFAAVDKMWKFNLQSSVIAGHVAAHVLKEHGFLVFTGASAALGATPGMIGYGVSKAATHQLVSSLAAENSGLPKGVNTVAVLPITLDTPSNRSAMPGANFSDWTPVSEIAREFLAWIGEMKPNAFKNGSLVEVKTENGKTTWTPVTVTVSKH